MALTRDATGAPIQRETWKQTAFFHGYRFVAWLGRTLPERSGRRFYTTCGRLAYHLLPAVRATVAANQGRVVGRPPGDPVVQAATKEAFARYARYWFDTFHVLGWSDEEVGERHVVDGREHMEAALAKGRGVIFALPHMGNWDVSGRWVASTGNPILSVAERLEPERLYELFLAHRRELGMEIVGLSDGAVGQQLASFLGRNGVVALVADRDLTGRGVEVQMFGATRRVPAGPALLSISTGAPLVVVSVYEMGGGWRCVMSEPIEVEPSGNRREDITALTRLMAAGFERAIAASPPDWHLFQPGWPS
jgi:lauroyl/myristoyl acyltransferase